MSQTALPKALVAALAGSGAERGYPSGVGSNRLREAAAGWLSRRFGVEVAPGRIAACIGTKELVAGVPHWLHLRDPRRDTVLYPALAYPTYEMGALLANCRAAGFASTEMAEDHPPYGIVWEPWARGLVLKAL